MKLSALAGGLAGSCALTLLHETVRRVDPDAPRMDRLGMNALSKLLRKTDREVPQEDTLFNITMAGDIISNALYYSLAGTGNKKQVWLKGTALGLVAGAGAVLLPKPLGLDEAASSRTTKTKLMTVAWYLAGGLVAAAAINLIENRRGV